MGQDLLLEGFVVPEGGFDIEGAVALVGELTPEDLESYIAETEQGETAPLGGPTADEQVAQARYRAVAALRLLEKDHRMAGLYCFAAQGIDVRVWLTGGGSWGDSPTEEFDQIHDLWSLPGRVLDRLLRRAVPIS
jgi:hypothetical protein